MLLVIDVSGRPWLVLGVGLGETHLHYGDVLPDPLVERGGKLFKLLEFLLRLRVEERVAGGRLGENIVELRDVGDDRLLVRFGGIDI